MEVILQYFKLPKRFDLPLNMGLWLLLSPGHLHWHWHNQLLHKYSSPLCAQELFILKHLLGRSACNLLNCIYFHLLDGIKHKMNQMMKPT